MIDPRAVADDQPTPAVGDDDLEARRLAAVRACGLSRDDHDPAFDGIAQVAATALRAPVALVSLVEETEQWFAAHIGYEASSTPIDVSFCAFAVQHPDELLVVPDTREDPRFRGFDVVTGPPHVRFYAGAPIRSPEGFGLGTLCVLDTAPRPEGLTDDEQRVLVLLARQVEQQLELRRTTAALERGEATYASQRGFLSAALANLTEGIVACDAEGRLTFFNTVTEQLHGQPTDTDLDPDEWSAYYHLYEADGVTPLPRERIPLLRALAGEQVREAEIVIAPPDRDARLISCSGQAFHDPDGRLLGAVITMRDVTDRRRNEAALRHSAEHDPLTGLPNRSVFSQRLEAALAGEDGQRTAVCFIDLNDFKRINDELGHPVGDQVLVAVAGRLDQTVKSTDTVARYGGDEFVVVLEDVAVQDLPAITARMRAALSAPVRIGRQLVPTAAAIGAAHAGADQLRDERGLLRLADQRMYDDKPR